MIAARVSVVAFAVLLTGAAALAAEAPPGASSCSGCHATNANAGTPVPPLKGRSAADIETAMAEYKTGKRQGTIMDRIAKGFSEEETKAIAAWYATQK
jgi:cytochrome subunit of sulfide dehydrogenase